MENHQVLFHGTTAAGLPHEPAAVIISDEQIKKIRELYRRKYGKDFESDADAKEYLKTVCLVFAWLLKNSNETKTHFKKPNEKIQ